MIAFCTAFKPVIIHHYASIRIYTVFEFAFLSQSKKIRPKISGGKNEAPIWEMILDDSRRF